MTFSAFLKPAWRDIHHGEAHRALSRGLFCALHQTKRTFFSPTKNNSGAKRQNCKEANLNCDASRPAIRATTSGPVAVYSPGCSAKLRTNARDYLDIAASAYRALPKPEKNLRKP